MASGSHDLTIKIWNTNNFSLVKTILTDHKLVESLLLLKSGYLASAGQIYGDLVKIWNLEDGSLIKNLNSVLLLQELHNGDLVTGSLNGTIKIWDADGITLKKVFSGYNISLHLLKVLKNGCLASTGLDKTIKIWDTSSGRLMINIKPDKNCMVSLAPLDNGYLASGCSNGSIII